MNKYFYNANNGWVYRGTPDSCSPVRATRSISQEEADRIEREERREREYRAIEREYREYRRTHSLY